MRPILLSVLGGLATFALPGAVPIVIAQQPAARDTVGRRDSVARLAPMTIQASVVPTAATEVTSNVPARISTVNGDALRSWKPRLLTDVLARQPGVSLYDDLGTPWKLNLTTRGFSVGPTVGIPPGISVFVDGVRQNEPDAQQVNFDLLPMEDVSHVELLSGSASLLGSNSLGGAINLVTSRGSGPAMGSLELTAGSFGAGAASARIAGSTANNLSYYASGGYENESGWRSATSARNGNAFVNLGRELDGRGYNVQVIAARSRAETAGSLPESIFDVAPRTNFTPGDLDDLANEQIAVQGHIGSTSRFGGTVYVRHSFAERFNVNQAPDPNVRARTNGFTLGATVDWRRALPLGATLLSWRAGIDAAASRVRTRIYNETDAAAELTTDVRSPSLDAAPYALMDYRVGRLTLSGGARYDVTRIPFHNNVRPEDNTESTNRSLSPRVGATVDVGAGVSVYASLGKAFRAPTIIELGCADPDAECPLPFALGDDPPLSPVRATTYEAGSSWKSTWVSVSASAFRTDVRDEIFFVASEQALLSGYFTNIPRTRRAGVELSVNGMLPKARGSWYVNATRTSATFQSDAELFSIRSDDDFTGSRFAGDNAISPGKSLPLVPRALVNVGVDGQLAMFSVGVGAHYVGTQWLRGDEANVTSPLTSHMTLALRAGVDIGAWNVSSILDNAFDSHAATFGTFNENRRTGQLERFLTPMNARTVKVVVRRQFGP